MKYIYLIAFSIIFISCENKTETKLISPKENLSSIKSKDYLIETTKYDSIKELITFNEINNLWIVGTHEGIYIIDKKLKRIEKYLKFDKTIFLKENKDTSTSIYNSFVDHYDYMTFNVNKSGNKLLVSFGEQKLAQIDLKHFTIDWLINCDGYKEYSDNGELIIVGTDYKQKEGTDTQEPNEYYSSLFLLKSQNGEFLNYFNEGASINKAVFYDNDSKLLVAYGWPHPETWVWDISKKDECIAKFEEDNVGVSDILYVGQNSFITVNGNGISKWNIQEPKEKNLILPNSNRGFKRFLHDKLTKNYLLFGFSTCSFVDQKLNLTDSVTFPIMFEGAEYSGNDSIIILENLMNNNAPPTNKTDGIEGFYSFNSITKELILMVTPDNLNEIIETNRK